MRPLTPRGFTLIELLVGVSLLGMLGAITTAVVTTAARSSARSVATLGAARTRFAFDDLLRQELRDASDSELVPASATQLGMRRAIGEASACASASSSVLLSRAEWSGTRAPEVGRDEVLILRNADSGTWQHAAITRVGTARCPVDTASAFQLDLDAPVATVLMVRVVEPVTLTAYRVGAADWLGLAPADGSSSVQPFAGPLASGVTQFSTATGSLVASIRPYGFATAVTRVPLGARP